MYFKEKLFKLQTHTPVSFEDIHLGRVNATYAYDLQEKNHTFPTDPTT